MYKERLDFTPFSTLSTEKNIKKFLGNGISQTYL
jgi:hypothetical protein